MTIHCTAFPQTWCLSFQWQFQPCATRMKDPGARVIQLLPGACIRSSMPCAPRLTDGWLNQQASSWRLLRVHHDSWRLYVDLSRWYVHHWSRCHWHMHDRLCYWSTLLLGKLLSHICRGSFDGHFADLLRSHGSRESRSVHGLPGLIALLKCRGV